MKTTPPARATAMVLMLFLGGLLAGAWAGVAAAARARDPYAALELFAQVLTTIETDYVDERDPDALVEAALEGMTGSLDPHSRWLSSDEARDFQEEAEGSYEGIGVEVRAADLGVEVARVLPGGPAERDGLRAGDVIVAVDHEDLAGLDLDQVAELLQGDRGESVVLTVRRDGELDEIATVRDRVHVESVEAERLPGGVVYARVVLFQQGAAAELDEKLGRLGREGPVRGVVLDVRDNPGGLLTEAVAVTDLFLDDGVIVSTRGRLDGSIEHRATPGGLPADVPVVLLVNGQSASASEIVAGALQDTGRAVLVGTRTYGKGSVQTLYRHEDDSALKLTVGRYYTPSGEPVADRDGRPPDHVIPYPAGPTPGARLQERIRALEDLEPAERDELLDLVDQLPEVEPEPADIPWDRAPSERLEVDPQLRAAVDLLLPLPTTP